MRRPATTETRPRIAILPDAIVDQIAAGEVVERPASVVKELVENALDAYATEIDVEIKGGGTESIRVSDNGIGMDRDAALLALRRHATSKIRSIDDLARVNTLGFRGEALPSIASVSKFTMLTRALDESAAVCIEVTGGRVVAVDSAGAQPGTTITVSDLFYNVPARRKFLKTAATESRRVAGWMTDLALGARRVGFRYASEGRTVFNVSPADDTRTRIGELLGHELARSLLELETRLDYLEVRGYLGRPDLAKDHRGRIYVYVNGRRIQDRALLHALTAGYGEYLPSGRYPVAVLFLTLPSDMVDVNVHPTKAEVRFLHPRLVHDAIYYGVNRILMGERTTAAMSPGDQRRPVDVPDDASLAPLREAAAQILGHRLRNAGRHQVTLWNELYRPGTGSDRPEQAGSMAHPPLEAGEARMAGSGSSPETSVPAAGEGARFYQFADVYIVAPTSDALIVIDQHTAHERILFEAVADRVNSDLTTTQNLLFPISIELDPPSWETFEANLDLFERTGFQVRPFGHRTALLEGVPAVLSGRAPERYFRETLEVLRAELKVGKDRLAAMAASFACKAAVKAGDRLSEAEMAALFDQLFATRHPFTCPHGRPTVVRIPRGELDRKFGRS